jgi:hypothetical protein
MRVEGVIVVVAFVVIFAEGKRVEQRGELEHPDIVAPDAIEDVLQPLFEVESVGDHQIGLGQQRHLPGGRLVVVGVGTAGHQDFEPRVVADQVGCHVAEDGGGGHHQGSVVIARVVRASGEQTGGEHQRGDDGKWASPAPLIPNRLTKMRIIPTIHDCKVPEDQSCDNSRSKSGR